MLLLFTGILIVPLFFGAQLQVPTVLAEPGFTSSNLTAPATNTCAGCHSGSATVGGSAVVTGFPSTKSYTPGVTQHLSVTVTDPTDSIWAYLLTARLATSLSSQAGSFTATDTTSTAVGLDIKAASGGYHAGTMGSATWNFDWTPPATSAGNVTFFLTGLADSPTSLTSGNGMYQSSVTLTPAAPPPAPNFSLSALPSSLTMTQGASGTSTITVAPLNGFTGSVGLAASGVPSGVTATFSPTSTTGKSTLTLAASSTAITGTSTVTITGASGSLSHTATLSLTVNAPAPAPNFSLSASPYTLTQGSNGTSTITVTPQNGFTGSVALSVSGLPSGVTASSFNPASTASTSVLTLTASSTAATGTFPVTITGTSGSLSHTATLSLTVNAPAPAPNFSLSASPSSLTVTQGASGTSTITVAPLNGFTGSVGLAASGVPSGVTATFSPTSTTGTSTLTLAASSTAATGTSTVTVTGTSGTTLSHTATLSLTVNAPAPAPNFSLSASPSSLTVTQGASGTSTITVTPQNGFTG